MLCFTLFLMVFIPSYWQAYGGTVFLAFCDVALFTTYLGLLLNNNVLVSMAAIGMLLPQSIWMLDFLSTGLQRPVLGLTQYMFDPTHSLWLRGLSLFHCWLPCLLCFEVFMRGYEPCAWLWWTLLSWIILIFCYSCTDNINFVRGVRTPQTMMPAWCWLGLIMLGLPLFFFYPTHLIMMSLQ